MVALSILILMPFALSYPLLSLHLLGVKIDASIWEGIWENVKWQAMNTLPLWCLSVPL